MIGRRPGDSSRGPSRRRGARTRTDLESRCLSSQGFLVGRAGRPEEGLELLRNALSLALDGNHVEAAVTAYWAMGATANDWSDYAAAQSAFEDAIVYCRANEKPEDEQFCLGCLVVVLENGATGPVRRSSRGNSSSDLRSRSRAEPMPP